MSERRRPRRSRSVGEILDVACAGADRDVEICGKLSNDTLVLGRCSPLRARTSPVGAGSSAFIKKAEGESRRYLESLTLKATT
jgi:hypothetical protein